MKNIINIILEEVTSLIKEYDKLGGGASGKVFEKDGYAYKITNNINEYNFAKEIFKNQHRLTTFPKIHWIKLSPNGRYYIIKRDLIKLPKSTESAKINNSAYEIRKYINNRTKGNEIDRLEYIKTRYGLSDKFIDFIGDLKLDIDKLDIGRHYIDFHSGNVGIDNNGDYVLFDY